MLALLLLFLCVIRAGSVLDLNICKDELTCFAPGYCFGPRPVDLESIGEDEPMREFSTGTGIRSDCPMMFLVRPYSNQKWLIIMTTLDPDVTRIRLNDPDFDFACQRYGGRNMYQTVRASFKSSDIKMISWDVEMLTCEFIVQFENLRKENNKKVAFEIRNRDGSMSMGTYLFDNILNAKVTCDPAVFTTTITQVNEFTTVEAPEPRRNRMMCRDEKVKAKFTWPEGSSEQEADSITCISDLWVIKYGGSQKQISNTEKVHARCVVDTRFQCDYIPRTAEFKKSPDLSKTDDGIRLKCPATHPHWFKNNVPILFSGEATCNFQGIVKGQAAYIWKIGEIELPETSEVKCVAHIPCKKASLPSSFCTEVHFCRRDGTPQCRHSNEMWCSKDDESFEKCEIRCDRNEGEWEWKGKEISRNLLNLKTECRPREESDTEAKKGWKWTTMVVSMTLVVLGIAAIAGIVAYICWRQHRRELEDNGILTRKKNKKKKRKTKRKRSVSVSSMPSSGGSAASKGSLPRTDKSNPKIPDSAAAADATRSNQPTSTPSIDTMSLEQPPSS